MLKNPETPSYINRFAHSAPLRRGSLVMLALIGSHFIDLPQVTAQEQISDRGSRETPTRRVINSDQAQLSVVVGCDNGLAFMSVINTGSIGSLSYIDMGSNQRYPVGNIAYSDDGRGFTVRENPGNLNDSYRDGSARRSFRSITQGEVYEINIARAGEALRRVFARIPFCRSLIEAAVPPVIESNTPLQSNLPVPSFGSSR